MLCSCVKCRFSQRPFAYLKPAMWEICSELRIKTPERRFGAVIVTFEQTVVK